MQYFKEEKLALTKIARNQQVLSLSILPVYRSPDMSKSLLFLVTSAIILLGSSILVEAAIVEKTFHVGNMTIERLCEKRTIVAINGQMPGPTIEATDGDTVIIHVINSSPYNITIHWHGIFQLMSAWADGPSYVTQCPIQPGNSYTYRFKIKGQEGTLWYHAHVSFLRATVYGALVVRPNQDHGSSSSESDDYYPFPRPHREIPIVLGEWWNANVVDVEAQALASGAAANVSDAFTINGKPGHLYPCSSSDNQIFSVNVSRGKTYLLRIINAALNTQVFFKIAGHNFTVVAVDASYTNPYNTDVLVLAPGHTVDALLVADAPPAKYYMAAHAYMSSPNRFDNTTTTAVLNYNNTNNSTTPIMPLLPLFTDTATANVFSTSMTSLITPRNPKVPLEVDEQMFVTFGMGLLPCDNPPSVGCSGPRGLKLASSMNNISFVLPDKISLLQAYLNNVSGIFTEDFPDNPTKVFNYTSSAVSNDLSLMTTVKGTRMKRLRFNSTVEIVLQNTALLGPESHPMHLHGFNFFILAQGIGNYDPVTARKDFNLVNPLIRNTVAVLPGGWAVIRFVANNPGVWILHCHIDFHLPLGLGTGFIVENGPTPETTLPPPPADLPRC